MFPCVTAIIDMFPFVTAAGKATRIFVGKFHHKSQLEALMHSANIVLQRRRQVKNI